MRLTVRLILVVLCALSSASALRGLAPPSLRVGVRVGVPGGPPLFRSPYSTHLLDVAAEPRSTPVTAAALRVCAGALVVASLLFGLSTSRSAASYPSTTRSPPASVTTALPPRLSYWDFGGRLQRLEDTSFTKEDAREMEAERNKEKKEMAATMQTNFVISTSLTVVSLAISLAANEGFVAKLFPAQT